MSTITDEIKEQAEELQGEGSEEKGRRNAGPKKYRIIIDEQDNTDKNNDVFVTDGRGTPYLIKRGHEVVVPEGVVNVLKEAVYTLIEKNENGEEVRRDIPRFALRVLGRA
ncbi:MAG: hypothetical protein K8I29_19545 [Alphaproteobacteria bacterium]|uniref:Uncharacterized protein n=1 Tax=Candidatus Nitrobium versatile TaxID=2884831 RepID=A0A953SI27_9BACT|nr:hypothetical protein [Candidatus Nitrobium versatile]